MGTANIADGKPWPAQSQPPTPRQTEGSGAAPGADVPLGPEEPAAPLPGEAGGAGL